MVAGRSMSRVWLRMPDDFWLHLRPSVKFTLVTLPPRDVCTPAPDTKFRHLYSIDIRLIAVDRLRVPRFGHRTVLLPSLSLLPSSSLSLSLFLGFFFFTKLTVISEISISSLLRMCWSCGPTRRARAVASRIQTSPSLSSRATYLPVPYPPSFSQSSGFLPATTKRNISTGRVLPATNLRRSNNSAPFVRLSIGPVPPPPPPRSAILRPYIGSPSFFHPFSVTEAKKRGGRGKGA